MRKLVILTFLLCGCVPVWACDAGYQATHIWWRDWRVASSESLWDKQKHTNFPLSHLFDGDKNTTWVFSGSGKNWRKGGWKSRYAIELKPRQPVTLDSLWIMNGYNKRDDLFYRNDRVVQIRITVHTAHGETVKTTRLSDKMGWHKVSLPRQTVKKIVVEFTGLLKGQGPDNDLCISELAFFNRGHKIDMKMPELVMFDKGIEGGDPPIYNSLITHNGKAVTRGQVVLQNPVWSPSNRYVCGVWQNDLASDAEELLWIVDTTTKKVLLRAPTASVTGLRWQSNSAVEANLFDQGEEKAFKKIYRVS